jgi:hypothetical protein
MSDELADCQLCLFAESAENKTATCLIYDFTGTHVGKPYYSAKIVLGGDKQVCNEVVDMVRRYMETVLKVPEHINNGAPPLRKPS